jgi:hypothetical protein
MSIREIAVAAAAVLALWPAQASAQANAEALAAAVAGPCSLVTWDEEGRRVGPNLTPCTEAINAAFAAAPGMNADELERIGQGFVTALSVPLPLDAPMPVLPIVNVFTQQMNLHLFRGCVPGFVPTITPTAETCSATIRIVLVAAAGLPGPAYQRNQGNAMCLSIQGSPAWAPQLLALIDAYVARGGLDGIAAARAECAIPPAP